MLPRRNTFRVTTLVLTVDPTVGVKEFRIDGGGVAGPALNDVELNCTQNTAHLVAPISTPQQIHTLKVLLIKALKELEDL